MAGPSKNSRVARRDASVPVPPKVTHLLYKPGKVGKPIRKVWGQYTSLEEAEAAQAKVNYRLIMVVK